MNRLLSLAGLLLLVPGCDSKENYDLARADDVESAQDASDTTSSDGDMTSAPGSSGGGTDEDGMEPPDDEPPLGDTAEPEDTADTGEPEEECDDVEPVTLYLSPDDSNSMSSPVQARYAVLDGWTSLSSVPIRTWEFLNYYSFDYTPADTSEGDVLAVYAAMVDDGDGDYVMQIGVSSRALTNDDRLPMNVTLVLDESGSMSGTAINMLKATSEVIAGSLKEGDVVSVVTWDTSNATVLDSHAVSGADDSILLSAINGMAAGGGTDLNGGLQAGYAMAQKNYSSDRINRIVLVSDGGANAGVTDINLISEAAGASGEDGIYMVGVGVEEAGSYNDELMDEVTDAGKGASVFIPDEDEAEKIFGDRFVEVMDVAARDVQVRLDLPPGFEIVKFSGEEYSGDPSEVEPQHIAPNDSVVFHQTLHTCAPEAVSDDTEITVTARYQHPVTFAEAEVSRDFTVAELADADAALLAKGAAVYAYAEALKVVGRAENDRELLGVALSALEDAEALRPSDPDLVEIREVIEALLD